MGLDEPGFIDKQLGEMGFVPEETIELELPNRDLTDRGATRRVTRYVRG